MRERQPLERAMRRLAICTLICLLAGLHAARAQAPAPPAEPKGPQDKIISGVFSPDRVASDAEAGAKKAESSGKAPFTRARIFYFGWNSMAPAEFEALGRHIVFLIAVWT